MEEAPTPLPLSAKWLKEAIKAAFWTFPSSGKNGLRNQKGQLHPIFDCPQLLNFAVGNGYLHK